MLEPMKSFTYVKSMQVYHPLMCSSIALHFWVPENSVEKQEGLQLTYLIKITTKLIKVNPNWHLSIIKFMLYMKIRSFIKLDACSRLSEHEAAVECLNRNHLRSVPNYEWQISSSMRFKMKWSSWRQIRRKENLINLSQSPWGRIGQRFKSRRIEFLSLTVELNEHNSKQVTEKWEVARNRIYQPSPLEIDRSNTNAKTNLILRIPSMAQTSHK